LVDLKKTYHMVHFEDAKVLGANLVCMITLQIPTIPHDLQSILFLATIIYTIVRIANEVKKFMHKKYTEDKKEQE